MNNMREQEESKRWNWAKRLTRFRLKRTNTGVTLREKTKEKKVLTMENTVSTKLTDFDPRMLMPEKQQDLVDWKALEPRPIREPDKYTGLQNWPGAGE